MKTPVILLFAALGSLTAFADVRSEYDAITVLTKEFQKYGGYDELAEENTLEYRLAKCDEAVAKATDDATRNHFRGRKAWLLAALRKYDEAMSLAKEIGDEALQARICRRRAARYYALPDEKLMREAIAHGLKAIEGKETARNLRPVVEDYLALKDWKGVIALAARFPKITPDAWLGVRLADAYCETGDWETAVRWYAKYPDFKPCEGFPNSYQRYAGALYALGLYEACLKVVDRLPTVGTFKDTNAYYRHVLTKKINVDTEKKGKRE